MFDDFEEELNELKIELLQTKVIPELIEALKRQGFTVDEFLIALDVYFDNNDQPQEAEKVNQITDKMQKDEKFN